MNWDTIKPQIKILFQGMSADPDNPGDPESLTVVWVDEPRPFTPTDTAAILLLSIVATSDQGRDETRTRTDLTQAQGQELQDDHVGNRYFTLTVRVESQIQTDTGSADEYLERVRKALYYRATRETLHSLNLAWVQVLPVVDLTAAVDDRNRSIKAFDILFFRSVTYTEPGRYGYLDQVPLSFTLTPQ